MSQRKPDWNTSRKILYFRFYECYFFFYKKKKIEVQTKVRFLLVENKLLSVDTALQTRGYIRSASTHITPNEKQFLLVYRSESDFECLQILMILPVSKYGECPIFRNRTSSNASLRSTICFVFR